MNMMRKNIIYFITFVIITLTLLGCAAARNIGYSNPPVIFAYSNSIPIIKDQSKVATIVTRNGSGISIVGLDLSKMRVSNDKKNKQSLVVDVLPGTYTITKKHFEDVSTQQVGNWKKITFKVMDDFMETIELEAGHVYWVKTSKNGIFIEKDILTDEHYFTDIASDKNFSNYLKQQIIESRNNAK